MDIKIEEVELFDETGALYATALEAMVEVEVEVEVDVDGEWSWHITSVDLLGFDGKRQRVTRTFSPYKNHVEFEYIRDELMRSRKVQLQGAISEAMADKYSSRADTIADRRRNANLHEMA